MISCFMPSGIGLLGLGEEFLDFHIQLVEILFGVAKAHNGVLAGVG